MKEVCEQFKYEHHNSTPYRPKANGAVEAANKNIKKILRNMVQGSRPWYEKLPFALLGYRTTFRTSVGATPYLLVYGTEAVIPAEVEIPSLRSIVEAGIEDTDWVKSRLEQLSLIDEKRLATVCFGFSAKYRLDVQEKIPALARESGTFDLNTSRTSFDIMHAETWDLKIHLLII
ncbi:uncharacterized protein LOC142167955 [Nicotiana tabacum]|uniref:Uncharacterized protein LOC142167955 n=1 Tax=Nicotiana tabacum TaxID=4097 RepID=A0AC58SIA1_TOBAC